ncbi:hypothetical protein [Yinghuangia soli]|uniref:GLTT repeat-containing protein n=1 Tax=Yinghuangia soli TaxID=2908204 RepID=A0AA41U4I1_9ACTN|nr:hypothetical protein [Yinghuangia soli]MCF2532935.1 hypothetical protein [Yinghuangia soli]
MSSTLPRRVAQAALLVAAAGAAPVLAAPAAHADLPLAGLGGLGGITQPDLAGLPQVGGDTLGGAGVLDEAAGLTSMAQQPEVAELGALAQPADLASLSSMAQPDLSAVTARVPKPQLSGVTGMASEEVSGLGQLANPDFAALGSVQPDFSDLTGAAQPDVAVPAAAKRVPAKAADAMGQRLENSILAPAMMGIGPSLPVAGYATDQSVNAAMPATDAALAHGTQQHIVTNSATTLDGVSTPLREVPQHL